MKLTAKQAADIAGGKVTRGDPRSAATGISTDTRGIRPGQAFVAIKGERFDGARFAAKAIKKGAPWVMVPKGSLKTPLPRSGTVIETDDTTRALGELAAAHRKKFDLRVAAVTGSIGKSSCKEMLAAMLSGKGRVLKNEGNLNNRIGLPLTLFRLDRSYAHAVLELGCNEFGEIADLARIAAPHTGLITRIAPVHLQGLGSIEGVAKAKTELIKEMPKGSTFVLNLDDPLIKKRARSFKGKTVGFSSSPDTPFEGESFHLVDLEKDVVAGRPKIRFRLQRKVKGKKAGRPVSFFLWSLARHDAINALAAAAAASTFGVSLSKAAEGLRKYKPLSGRGGVVKTRKGVFIMDETYNSNPVSVCDALETMAWWSGPMRKVALLGEMLELGPETKEYHRELGRKAAESGVDILLAKGDDAKEVVDAAMSAGLPPGNAFIVEDNDQAARLLKKLLRKGDWVLCKGSRGMRLEAVVRELV